MAQTEYDRLPYPSYAHWQTQISHLCLIGRLFGMNPPDVRRCRVLELGGASGGNLIPLAAQYPQSRFLCVDLSEVQIEEGRKHALALGLSNIEFQVCSILDFRPKDKFDYVICHGVFSWVPNEVQDQILEILAAHLQPDGIAVVSYNTLPGWNLVRSLRDMMMYHCSGISDLSARAQQARALLKFVEDSQGDAHSLWAEAIHHEAVILAKQPDSYLVHDHLNENNEQLYFYQFMDRARQRRLQYLGDAEISRMYLGNQPDRVAQTLAPLGDIVRVEQYLDFVTNRRFRYTLLCREGLPLSRKISARFIDQCHIRSLLAPDNRDMPAAARPGRTFRAPNGTVYSPTDELTVKVFLVMAEMSATPMDAGAIVAEVIRRHGAINADAVRSVLDEAIMRLFFAGAVMLYPLAPNYTGKVSDRPAALPVARYQAAFQSHVTNARHEMVTLTDVERIVLQRLDGTSGLESLVAHLLAQISTGRVWIRSEGVPLRDQAQVEREISVLCAKSLQAFADVALLVA